MSQLPNSPIPSGPRRVGVPWQADGEGVMIAREFFSRGPRKRAHGRRDEWEAGTHDCAAAHVVSGSSNCDGRVDIIQPQVPPRCLFFPSLNGSPRRRHGMACIPLRRRPAFQGHHKFTTMKGSHMPPAIGLGLRYIFAASATKQASVVRACHWLLSHVPNAMRGVQTQ